MVETDCIIVYVDRQVTVIQGMNQIWSQPASRWPGSVTALITQCGAVLGQKLYSIQTALK